MTASHNIIDDLSQEGIAYRTLDWRDALEDSPILEETIALLKEIQPDIVLGADIVGTISVAHPSYSFSPGL